MKEVHKKPGTFCGEVGNFLENILADLDNLRIQFVRRKLLNRRLLWIELISLKTMNCPSGV
ncbi:hypothetical protein [Neobacillus drentensis]|uniref:hypothetical protein n=1 Tax=Neobacillus drentensis TaxID=220684 RepID=UPI000825CDBF|nr:hypothetical protein [Neobacillus drentensis]